MKNIFKRIIERIKHEKIRKKTQKLYWNYGLNKEKRNDKIIVSLTTFPKRIDKIELCIKSLLNQSVKPDKIIIYLGKDCSDYKVWKSLERYKEFGVEVKIDYDKDLKSHKKYFYAMKEFEKALIITVDDDLIYPYDMIESLYDTYKKYPNCIVARRVHYMVWKNNKLEPYKKWKGEYTKIKHPSYNLFPTTGAGTLFPPGSLQQEALNEEKIIKYAFTADDVWLKFMSILNKTKVVWAKNDLPMPTTINDSQEVSLTQKNVGEQMNDEYIKKIMFKYKITKKDFE